MIAFYSDLDLQVISAVCCCICYIQIQIDYNVTLIALARSYIKGSVSCHSFLDLRCTDAEKLLDVHVHDDDIILENVTQIFFFVTIVF